MSKLLEIRSTIKGKKPTFTRQESHRKKKLESGEWRKPRGMHSKMRLHQRGKKRSPETGWGSPQEVEGLHPSGLRPVVVATTHQIDALKKEEGAIIGSTVGMKKRAMLSEHAKKKNVKVLNVSVDRFLKSVSEEMAQRKASQKRSKVVEAPKKEENKAVAKAEEKESSEKPSDEEQKKKEKEEKDRLLTKRS
jgi:large subunit ribosomal protein L32e